MIEALVDVLSQVCPTGDGVIPRKDPPYMIVDPTGDTYHGMNAAGMTGMTRHGVQVTMVARTHKQARILMNKARKVIQDTYMWVEFDPWGVVGGHNESSVLNLVGRASIWLPDSGE